MLVLPKMVFTITVLYSGSVRHVYKRQVSIIFRMKMKHFLAQVAIFGFIDNNLCRFIFHVKSLTMPISTRILIDGNEGYYQDY